MSACLNPNDPIVAKSIKENGFALTYLAYQRNNFVFPDNIDDVNKLISKEEQTKVEKNNNSGFVNHSGGAVGADSAWDTIGTSYGIVNKHYYHGQKTPKGNTEISNKDLLEGIGEVKQTYGVLGRPDKPEYYSLHGRNWFQVKNADAIYAVSTIISPGEMDKKGFVSRSKKAVVSGGTGYAVEMAIQNNKPVYVFNQTDTKNYKTGWYEWNAENNNFLPIDTPTLTTNFAGIGTREINDAGRKAIKDVYEKTFFNVGQTKPDMQGTYISSLQSQVNNVLPIEEPMNYIMSAKDNIYQRDTSTIDEIISGNRTSTTRGYWHNVVKGNLKSVNDLVGKVITFSKDNKKVQVMVDSVYKIGKIDRQNQAFLEQWSQSEGWTKEYLLKETKVGEYQVKFHVVSNTNKPTQQETITQPTRTWKIKAEIAVQQATTNLDRSKTDLKKAIASVNDEVQERLEEKVKQDAKLNIQTDVQRLFQEASGKVQEVIKKFSAYKDSVLEIKNAARINDFELTEDVLDEEEQDDKILSESMSKIKDLLKSHRLLKAYDPFKFRATYTELAHQYASADDFIQVLQQYGLPYSTEKGFSKDAFDDIYGKLFILLKTYRVEKMITPRIVTDFNSKFGKGYRYKIHVKEEGKSTFSGINSKRKGFWYKQSYALNALHDFKQKFAGFEYYIVEGFNQVYNEKDKEGKEITKFLFKGDTKVNQLNKKQLENYYLTNLYNGLADLGSFSDKGFRVITNYLDTDKFTTVAEAKKTFYDFMKMDMKVTEEEAIAIGKDIQDNLYSYIAKGLLPETFKTRKEHDKILANAYNEAYTVYKIHRQLAGNAFDFKNSIDYTKRLAGSVGNYTPLDKKATGLDKIKILVMDDEVVENDYTINGVTKKIKANITDSISYMLPEHFINVFVRGTHGLVGKSEDGGLQLGVKPIFYETGGTNFYGKTFIAGFPDVTYENQIRDLAKTTPFHIVMTKSAIKRMTGKNATSINLKKELGQSNDLSGSVIEVDINSIGVQILNQNAFKGSSPYPSQAASVFSDNRLIEEFINTAHEFKGDRVLQELDNPQYLVDQLSEDESNVDQLAQLKSNPELITCPAYNALADVLAFTRLRANSIVRRIPGDYPVVNPNFMTTEDLNFIRPNTSNGLSVAEVIAPASYGNVGDRVIITRIPTDNKHSFFVAKIVSHSDKRLGNTMIVPNEFYTLAGIDNDGDQLSVWRQQKEEAKRTHNNLLEYLKDSNPNLATFLRNKFKTEIEDPNSTSYMDYLNSEQYAIEQAFNMMVTDYLNPNNLADIFDTTTYKDVYKYFLGASILDLYNKDNNTDYKTIKELEDNVPNIDYEAYYNKGRETSILDKFFFVPSQRIQNSFVITSVKKAIGIQARVMKVNQLLSNIGFALSTPVIVDGVSYSEFKSSQSVLKDPILGDYKISRVFSSILAAAVDAVKNPKPLFDIQFNGSTGNVISTMTTLGIPPTTINRIIKDNDVVLFSNLMSGDIYQGTKDIAEDKLFKYAYEQNIKRFTEANDQAEIKKLQVAHGVRYQSIIKKGTTLSKDFYTFVDIYNLSYSLIPFNDIIGLTSSNEADQGYGKIEEALSSLLEAQDSAFGKLKSKKYRIDNGFRNTLEYQPIVSVVNSNYYKDNTFRHIADTILKAAKTPYYVRASEILDLENHAINTMLASRYVDYGFNTLAEAFTYGKNMPQVKEITNMLDSLNTGDLKDLTFTDKFAKAYQMSNSLAGMTTKDEFAALVYLFDYATNRNKDGEKYYRAPHNLMAYAALDKTTALKHFSEVYSNIVRETIAQRTTTAEDLKITIENECN